MNSIRVSIGLLVIALLLAMPPVSAARIVDGSLGDWLVREAGPRLAEIIDHHPRLEGETLRISAMVGGRIVPITDGLSEDIRRQLTSLLLGTSGARLMTREPGRCSLGPVAHHVLGIEINADARPHRVTVAIVDVDEGVWVNGSHLVWTGELTSIQVRERLRRSVPGTGAGSGLRVSDAAGVAVALGRELDCLELAAPVYVDRPEDRFMSDVAGELKLLLMQRTVLTEEPGDAQTILSLRASDSRVTLMLGGAGRGSRAAATVQLPEERGTLAVSSGVPRGGAVSRLLSPIEVGPRDGPGRCERGDDDCVEVGLELFERAWTILFYTSGGRLVVGCEPPERVRAGRLHFGLNVPTGRGGDRPDLGFYVLAVTEQAQAMALHEALTAKAASCRTTRGELASLTPLLRQAAGVSDWQHIHLAREGRRIVEFR